MSREQHSDQRADERTETERNLEPVNNPSNDHLKCDRERNRHLTTTVSESRAIALTSSSKDACKEDLKAEMVSVSVFRTSTRILKRTSLLFFMLSINPCQNTVHVEDVSALSPY